jgi:hypothetical protein
MLQQLDALLRLARASPGLCRCLQAAQRGGCAAAEGRILRTAKMVAGVVRCVLPAHVSIDRHVTMLAPISSGSTQHIIWYAALHSALRQQNSNNAHKKRLLLLLPTPP